MIDISKLKPHIRAALDDMTPNKPGITKDMQISTLSCSEAFDLFLVYNEVYGKTLLILEAIENIGSASNSKGDAKR